LGVFTSCALAKAYEATNKGARTPHQMDVSGSRWRNSNDISVH
jgi:hypothetical protein